MHQQLRHLGVAQALAAMRSGPQGLSEPEASHRLGQYGANRLDEAPRKPWWRSLVGQFAHTMAVLLWVAGGLAWLAAMPELAGAIWLVNLINGSFSYWQEHQAERAAEELRRLLPHRVRLRREGAVRELDAEQVVPGDLMLLSEGDHVAADARLLEQHALRVDQSNLTGESLPVAKTAETLPGDHLGPLEATNMVFAGSTVVSGTAVGLVCATGMNSEFGKIARLTQVVENESSPLEREVRRTTRIVTYLAVGCGLVFMALAVGLAGTSPRLAIPFALGMVVAFVPEGLAPTLTLALAIGVRRMAARKALVKRLSAVETLGAATAICTDKTGTLTCNQISVLACWDGHAESLVSSSGLQGAAQLDELLAACALCNDASLAPPVGDPTEVALLNLCRVSGRDLEALRGRPRLAVLPFDSRRKRMTTVHPHPEGRVAYLKGAPSMVLERCAGPLDRAGVRAQEDAYARRGWRVLAVARRLLGPDVAESELETEMEFLGLVAMGDPPRAEVPAAIASCHQAGIRLFMITGDHGVTGLSVARQTGLVKGTEVRVVTGQELDGMSEAELRAVLAGEVVFARATPENKLKVVSALQAQGHVVAVTGDGVNDAPALKRADIGVAMGCTGSDVARESADVVLADDSFASIVSAVEEGRAVYANIRHFISYILTSNVAEAVPLVVFALSAGSVPLALPVMLVLAIDLGTDMLPALALGVEPPEPGLMSVPPRSAREHLINTPLLLRCLLLLGLSEAAVTMGAFFLEFHQQGFTAGWPHSGAAYASACTAALGGTIAAQVGNVLAHRSDRRPFWQVGWGRNGLLWTGILLEVAGLLALAYWPPLQRVFGTAPLSSATWLFLAACLPVLLVVDEIRKQVVVKSARY